MNDIRNDLLASLACHAVILGGLVWVGAATSQLTATDILKANAQDEATLAAGKTDPSRAEADAEKTKELETAKDAVEGKEPTPPAEPEPGRTSEETNKALVGEEVRNSVEMAVPADAPAAIKSEIAAAIERAVTEAMNASPSKVGVAPSRAAIELAAAESVARKLTGEINDAFAVKGEKDFPRRAFDAALGSLEKAAAEVLGPKMRELITADGAAMAGDDSAQAPRHAAELAKNDERAFHAALDKEARRVLGEVAAPLLGASAAAAIEKKLAEKGVSPDAATMAKLSQNVGEGVAANAVGRGFNTHEVWKPSKELILPGTSNEKPGAALAAKLGGLSTKQDELFRATLAALAANAAKSAKWNDSIDVSKETEAKISALHRLETLIANIKAGRGGASDSSLAAALAALLGNGPGSGPGSGPGGPANNSNFDFDGSGRWGGSGRNFKEDEYQMLLARLAGRPANAGATSDLQRVAGDPVTASATAGGLLPPERIVSLATAPPPPAVIEVPAEIQPPPFPSATNTAAPYASRRPVIDGDLADWNLNAPRAEVRLLENNTHLATGPDVFLQWRAEGLYFAYRLADAGGIQISDGAPYHGDCVELFVDTTNSRALRMRDSNSANQYFFMPFGFKGDPTRSFERAGGGTAVPVGQDLAALNSSRTISFCTAKKEPGGYTVEGFLSIEALRRRLAPGIYLGFDVSVSPDFDFKNQIQWAAAKSLGNWDRPNTWGDLLLLGTTARLTFRNATGSERRVAVASESLEMEVADADMNLDSGARETVAVKIARKGGAGAQVLLLTETGPDTGVFKAPLLLQGAGENGRRGALAVAGGDVVELTYIDAVNASGAHNQPIAQQLEIGWPVMRFSAKTAR